jgi:hypothetical protein
MRLLLLWNPERVPRIATVCVSASATATASCKCKEAESSQVKSSVFLFCSLLFIKNGNGVIFDDLWSVQCKHDYGGGPGICWKEFKGKKRLSQARRMVKM